MQVGIVMHWDNPADWNRIRSRADRAPSSSRYGKGLPTFPASSLWLWPPMQLRPISVAMNLLESWENHRNNRNKLGFMA